MGRDPHLKWQGIPGMKIALSQKKPYCGWTHCFDMSDNYHFYGKKRIKVS